MITLLAQIELPSIWRGWQFISIVTVIQTAICIWMAFMLHAARKRREYKPFWEILQTKMAEALHHPHTPELDGLLEKLENKPTLITPLERARLESLLREKANDPNETKDERNRAEFLLFAMREVVLEKTSAAT